MPTDLGAGLKARGQQMWLKLRSFVRFPRTEWGAAKIPAKAVGDKNSGTVPKRLRDLLKAGPSLLAPEYTQSLIIVQHFPLSMYFAVRRIEPGSSHVLGKYWGVN